MQPRSIGKEIKTLLKQGVPHRSIRKKLVCSAATVSYHARKLGLQKTPRPSYDWNRVQNDIDLGMSMGQILEKYGFSKSSWSKSIAKGKIVRKTKYSELSFDDLIKTFDNQKINPYRKKLLRKHIVKETGNYACTECGLGEWRGKRLSLELDHIDGNPKNNVRSNLRILCPNCHCITNTWRGRNIKKPAMKKVGL